MLSLTFEFLSFVVEIADCYSAMNVSVAKSNVMAAILANVAPPNSRNALTPMLLQQQVYQTGGNLRPFLKFR